MLIDLPGEKTNTGRMSGVLALACTFTIPTKKYRLETNAFRMSPLSLLPPEDTHVPNVLGTLTSCCGPFVAAVAVVAAVAASSYFSL